MFELDQKDYFYTFKEYMKKEDRALTASMEDYLEMIFRLSCENKFTRVHELSKALNVKPPSATKMVQRLAELKLLKYEKYGVIILEEQGKVLGEELLNRHNTIKSFLKIVGVEEEEVHRETEKMEHTVSRKTTKCMEDFVGFIKENPQIQEGFIRYKTDRDHSK